MDEKMALLYLRMVFILKSCAKELGAALKPIQIEILEVDVAKEMSRAANLSMKPGELDGWRLTMLADCLRSLQDLAARPSSPDPLPEEDEEEPVRKQRPKREVKELAVVFAEITESWKIQAAARLVAADIFLRKLIVHLLNPLPFSDRRLLNGIAAERLSDVKVKAFLANMEPGLNNVESTLVILQSAREDVGTNGSNDPIPFSTKIVTAQPSIGVFRHVCSRQVGRDCVEEIRTAAGQIIKTLRRTLGSDKMFRLALVNQTVELLNEAKRLFQANSSPPSA